MASMLIYILPEKLNQSCQFCKD